MLRRLIPRILYSLLVLSLPACAPPQVETTPAREMITPSPTVGLQTTTPSPAPSATATQTIEAPTPEITLLPSATSTPAFQMCSPLAWETVPELWEIVTNPYKFLGPGREDGHHGVDLAHYRRKGHLSMLGEEITSVLPGRIAASIDNRLPYGNMVIVETPYSALPPGLAVVLKMAPTDSLYLLYAHMLNAPEVALDEPVACGQLLGQVGTSGLEIVNEHLHLETRLGTPGVSFANMAYYDTTANPEEMAAYVRWRTSGEFRSFDPMVLFAAYLAWLGQPVPTAQPTAGA